MQSLLTTLLTLLAVTLSLPAAAADKPASPAPPAASPAAPVPDAAFVKAKRDELKRLEGTWTCEGKVVRPEGELAMTFTMTAKPVADGTWLQTSKAWSKPTPRKQEGLLGWDVSAGMFKHVEVTSDGAMVVCTSPGWTGESEEWQCDGAYLGKPAKRRFIGTRKGDRQSDTIVELQLADGTWQRLAQSTCKR